MKSTDKFLNDIKAADNYVPIEGRNETEIGKFLKAQLVDVNLQQMFSNLDIDSTNGYKYINGSRTITRDILLKILVFLQYDFEQIQGVLKQFEFTPLYAKNKRDAAIIYCIYNNFTYGEIKAYLAEYNIKQL